MSDAPARHAPAPRPRRFLPYLGDRLAAAEHTMFCFPHAGGAASAYRGWVRASPALDVQPVQLPGREHLLDLPLVDDMDRLTALLGQEIADVSDRPFVLFGHSMGGAVAAEVAAWLHRHGHRTPELLVVSARAPADPSDTQLRARLGAADSDDDELTRKLIALGGTDPEVFDEPELRALLLAVVRNDIRLLQDHRPGFDRLTVPVLALGGDRDPTGRRELAQWQLYTSGPCAVRMFPGGHFYLARHRDAVLATIIGALRAPEALRGPETPRRPEGEAADPDRGRTSQHGH